MKHVNQETSSCPDLRGHMGQKDQLTCSTEQFVSRNNQDAAPTPAHTQQWNQWGRITADILRLENAAPVCQGREICRDALKYPRLTTVSLPSSKPTGKAQVRSKKPKRSKWGEEGSNGQRLNALKWKYESNQGRQKLWQVATEHDWQVRQAVCKSHKILLQSWGKKVSSHRSEESDWQSKHALKSTFTTEILGTAVAKKKKNNLLFSIHILKHILGLRLPGSSLSPKKGKLLEH